MLTDKTLDDLLHQLRLIEEHREKNCEIKIRKYYKELMKDLNNFLGNEYAELAQDDKLTFEILHSKGKYARFIEEVEQRTNYFTGQAAKTIKDTVQTTYKKAFDGMVKAVEQSQSHYDLKLNLKGIKATTSDVIKNAVKNTFLEDALEKNHKTVIYDIKQQIGVGLSHGDRMSTMAKRINEQLDKDYKKATQIVRTECHRVREAGYQDSSEHINNMLKESDCDYVMVKVWKTKKDERVRPQQRRKSKKGWKTTFSNSGANHMVMDGITVLVDEKFKLSSGAEAITPGQSGVASEDINCRCGVSRDFMTKDEYAKISGKKAGELKSMSVQGVEESRDSASRSITKITPEAIDGVEKVNIPGYTDGECKYIQQQHKELLETAMLDNDSKETAFIHSRDFRDRRVIYGTEKRIEMNTDDLKLQSGNLFVMHNHPRNSSFSRNDVVKFLTDDNIKTLSIVKNNGGVEVITKQEKIGIKNLYHYGMKLKILKNISSEQALNQLQKERIIKWVK